MGVSAIYKYIYLIFFAIRTMSNPWVVFNEVDLEMHPIPIQQLPNLQTKYPALQKINDSELTVCIHNTFTFLEYTPRLCKPVTLRVPGEQMGPLIVFNLEIYICDQT